MPGGLPKLLRRVHELAARRLVSLTLKADRELAALELGLDIEDACDIVAGLAETDFSDRLRSTGNGEWMYVFRPSVAGLVMYVKLVVRETCVVISFHEDEGVSDEEGS
jgi:hypothetical protein